MKKWLLIMVGVLQVSLLSGETTQQVPTELLGTKGKFDFIKIDSVNHRLLACHTGNGSLDVIDLKTSKLIASVPTGAAQGVACDNKGHRYFVSCSVPPQLTIVDSNNLTVLGTVPLPSSADLLAYQSTSGRVYVCNDEKPELWVVDPEAKQILSTISLPGGGMEDLGFNADETALFQCLKESSELAKISPSDGKILMHWPTAPATSPHGLALIPGTVYVLIAGGNGKLVLMSLLSGEVLSSADISQRVDEIAYDPITKRVFCASGLGLISVVSVDDKKLTALNAIPAQKGGHSIAVDAETKTVWIAYLADTKALVQAIKEE